MNTSKDLLSLSGTDMLLLGLEFMRHKARKPKRRVTVTERQIYDRNTQQIITLQTKTISVIEG